MYEGAIKFLEQAKNGLETNDIVKFCKFLSKGQAIIAELMNTLDFEKGGRIAKDLDRLYDFMLFYLTEANLYRDPKRIQKVITLIDTIYAAYKEIIEGQKVAEELPQAAAAPAKQPEPGKPATDAKRVHISL